MPAGQQKNGRRELMLMSADQYDRLQAADPLRVFGPGETPAELAETFLPELDRLIAEGCRRDEGGSG